MKYIAPIIVFAALAMAGAATARAELLNYGPYLYGQLEQSKKSTAYGGELAKGQKSQASQSTAFGKTLETQQKSQASQSATFGKTLETQQKSQASQSAAFTITLAKGQQQQSALSTTYAKQMDTANLAYRGQSYHLRDKEEQELKGRGELQGYMAKDAARDSSAAPVASAAPATAKALQEAPSNAAPMEKPSLNDALKAIDDEADKKPQQK